MNEQEVIFSFRGSAMQQTNIECHATDDLIANDKCQRNA